MAKVLNVTGHSIDLDDGRTLAPGEEAEDVNTEHPHNAAVIDQGFALVVEEAVARKGQSSRPAKDAPDDTTGEDKNS